MFRISTDVENRLLLVETSGLGTLDEVMTFKVKEEQTLRDLGWSSGQFVMLMHTLDTLPQPQDVIQALQDHLHSVARKPYRLAVVKGGAIGAMQTRRVVKSDHAAHFTNLAEARAWLAECGLPR